MELRMMWRLSAVIQPLLQWSKCENSSVYSLILAKFKYSTIQLQVIQTQIKPIDSVPIKTLNTVLSTHRRLINADSNITSIQWASINLLIILQYTFYLIMHFAYQEQNLSEIGLFTFYKQQQDHEEMLKSTQREIQNLKKKLDNKSKIADKQSIMKMSYPNNMLTNKKNMQNKSKRLQTQILDHFDSRNQQKEDKMVSSSTSKMLQTIKVSVKAQISNNLKSCTQLKAYGSKQQKEKVDNKSIEVIPVLLIMPQNKTLYGKDSYRPHITQPNIKDGHSETYQFYQQLAYKQALKNGIDKLKELYHEHFTVPKKTQANPQKLVVKKNSKVIKLLKCNNLKLSDADFKYSFLRKLQYLQEDNQISNAIYKQTQRNNHKSNTLHEQNFNYIHQLINNNYLKAGSNRNADKRLRQVLKFPDLKTIKTNHSQANSPATKRLPTHRQRKSYRDKIVIHSQLRKESGFKSRKKAMVIEGMLIKKQVGFSPG